jgi:hypothetical protein
MILDGCQLEVDEKRGVIYVHSPEGITRLRISGVPEIPEDPQFMDINVKQAVVGYTGAIRTTKTRLP